MSLTAIDSVVTVLKLVSLDVARMVMLWLVAVSASRAAATVTTPVLASMAKEAAGIIVEAVADRVAAIGIGRIGRDADGGTHDGIFVDGIGGRIRIAHRADRPFIDIRNVDRKRLAGGCCHHRWWPALVML